MVSHIYVVIANHQIAYLQLMEDTQRGVPGVLALGLAEMDFTQRQEIVLTLSHNMGD